MATYEEEAYVATLTKKSELYMASGRTAGFFVEVGLANWNGSLMSFTTGPGHAHNWPLGKRVKVKIETIEEDQDAPAA